MAISNYNILHSSYSVEKIFKKKQKSLSLESKTLFDCVDYLTPDKIPDDKREKLMAIL